jgi:hypothetical protein
MRTSARPFFAISLSTSVAIASRRSMIAAMASSSIHRPSARVRFSHVSQYPFSSARWQDFPDEAFDRLARRARLGRVTSVPISSMRVTPAFLRCSSIRCSCPSQGLEGSVVPLGARELRRGDSNDAHCPERGTPRDRRERARACVDHVLRWCNGRCNLRGMKGTDRSDTRS